VMLAALRDGCSGRSESDPGFQVKAKLILKGLCPE
jgi:hypothetical protein